MLSKRKFLEMIAEFGTCDKIYCSNCPYNNEDEKDCGFKIEALKLGAKEMLKTLDDFDKSKVLTCVTSDMANVGMKGFFGNSINEVKDNFIKNRSFVLDAINEDMSYVFDCTEQDITMSYLLFYPIETDNLKGSIIDEFI